VTTAGTIITGGDDKVVRIWSVQKKVENDSEEETWKVVKTFELSGHTNAIAALCEHPTENWFCSAGKDGACKIWDFSAGKLLLDIPCMVDGLAGVGSMQAGKPARIECRGCTFSADGSFLYTIQSARKGAPQLIK
jgi:WD40 repeat protein